MIQDQEEAEDMIERELDFSDLEEERECPFSMDERKKVIEAVLFVTDRPTGLTQIANAFGMDDNDAPLITHKEVEEALDEYKLDLEEENRSFRLKVVSGGYQLRTSEEMKPYLQNTIKAKTFRLTGPTLETLSIVAYKQPITKSQVDDVRGVDSSHLNRGLMDKDLLAFAGKSELPGKPMLYKTTSKFLEVFSLRNLNELPSLSEIEALIPEGIGMEEEKEEEQTLSQLTGKLSENSEDSYSVSEEEHDKIVGELSVISTSTEFFEDEKKREKERKEQEKAENIREALMVGEEVSTRNQNWLLRFDEKLKALEAEAHAEPDIELNSKTEADTGSETEIEASAEDDTAVDFSLQDTDFEESELDEDEEILDLSFSESEDTEEEVVVEVVAAAEDDDISVDDEVEPLKDI